VSCGASHVGVAVATMASMVKGFVNDTLSTLRTMNMRELVQQLVSLGTRAASATYTALVNMDAAKRDAGLQRCPCFAASRVLDGTVCRLCAVLTTPCPTRCRAYCHVGADYLEVTHGCHRQRVTGAPPETRGEVCDDALLTCFVPPPRWLLS